MDREGSSPYTPDQEPFLASAAGIKKTVMDDITMTSLPGTPIAASTVIRQKGDLTERITANDAGSRGSLFGSSDPSLSQSRSKDSPYFMTNPENTIQESPLEGLPDGDELEHSEGEFAADTEHFLKTQNVSEMLQNIPFSQLSVPDREQSRASLLSEASDTSLGILSLRSMQDDIANGLIDGDGNFEEGQQSVFISHKDLPKITASNVSNKGQKDATNQLLQASLRGVPQQGEYDDSPLSRGHGSVGSLKPIGGQRLSRAFTDNSPEAFGGEDGHHGANPPAQSTSDSKPSGMNRACYNAGTAEMGVNGTIWDAGSIRTNGKQRDKTAHQGGKRGSSNFQANDQDSIRTLKEHSDIAPVGREGIGVPRGKEQAGSSKVFGTESRIPRESLLSEKQEIRDERVMQEPAGKAAPPQQAPSGTLGLGLMTRKPAGKAAPPPPQQAPCATLGLGLMTPGDEEEDHQIDQESLQAGLEELDAIFFEPSNTSKSERSGSGDGEESQSSSVMQSPRSTQRERLEDVSVQRTASQMSVLSLDFGISGDQGNFLQDAFEDEDKESEIDTDDEIEAARKESGIPPAPTTMDDIVRPGIEGGSSGDEDQIHPVRSTLEPRQSAEGVVTTSPVPGDGGGGGDGMSDGGSDSGASMGERSPVRNGVSGSDQTQNGDRDQGGWQDGGPFSSDRNVEGETRSQPVGDGIMNDTAAMGRQVRFASHDDVTRWTPSGSAFHSRLRRPRKSQGENINESLFLAASSVTPTPQDQEPNPGSMHQFLQPSHHSMSGQGTEVSMSDWSQQEDSLRFSQRSSITPSSLDPLDGRECSLGSFGLAPADGDGDLTFSQRVSFGEDFSVLEAEGGSGSDASSKRSSTEDARGTNRRPVSGHSSHNSKGTVYFDDEGQGVTDLAFRTSLPLVHKLGAINPFESFSNQDEIEEGIMREIDFGIDPDEKFLPAEEAAALIDADESKFLEENIFHQDEHMSPEASNNASGWSIPNASHVTVQDSITGKEDFCRISLGTFFGTRTGALGSLSGESGVPRPSFGIKDMVSPPAREPAAIFVDSDQSGSRQEGVSGEETSPPQDKSLHQDRRGDGEGGTSEGGGPAPGKAGVDRTDHSAESSVVSSGSASAQIESEKFSDQGRETPPLTLMDVQMMIGTIPSNCNSEEIYQKILASYEELHKPDRDWSKGGPTADDKSGQSVRRKENTGKVECTSSDRSQDPQPGNVKERRYRASEPKASASEPRSRVKQTRPARQDRPATGGSKGVPRSKGSGRSSGELSRGIQQKGRTKTPRQADAAVHGRQSKTSAKIPEEREQCKLGAQHDVGREKDLVPQKSRYEPRPQQARQEEAGKQIEIGRSLLRESVDEGRGNNWATSSSLDLHSLSPRGFFKSGKKNDKESLSLSPKRYEVEVVHSSGEEEEDISPIFEKKMDLQDGEGETVMRHSTRPTALLREESEPDGEPNVADSGMVSKTPRVSQPSTFHSAPMSQTQHDKTTKKYSDSTLGAERSAINSPVTIGRKKRYLIAGKHEVTMLTESQWMHSFDNTTMEPTNDNTNLVCNTEVGASPAQQVISQKGHISSSGISSSSLSSEDEHARSSVSPPLAKSVLNRSSRNVHRTAVNHVDVAEQNVHLHSRLKLGGQEANVGKYSIPSSSHQRMSSRTDHPSHPSRSLRDRYDPSSGIEQAYQQDMNMHVSAPLPVLSTSQSVEGRLANQVIHSRPGSTISGDYIDSRLSGQSLDAYPTSFGSYPSQQFLGETFSNLGRRTVHDFQGRSYEPNQAQLRHTRGLSFQGYWTQGPQGLDAGGLPPYSIHLQGTTMRSHGDLHQQPPIMSIGSVPRGLEHPVPPYGGPQVLGIPPATDPHLAGYYTMAGNLNCDRHSGASADGGSGLSSEYQRGTTCQLVFPAEARFEGVCCVGIASQTSLPLRNTSSRWLHCLIEPVMVTANREKVAHDSHSPFLVKQRTNIAPHTTEFIKVMFVPKHPGIYTALLHVQWSMVVPDATQVPPRLPPSVVTVQALAESPSVEVLEGKELNFGEMVYGSYRSKSVHVINRGHCTVPVRLTIMNSSSSLNCFSISTGDKKSDTVTVSPGGGTHTSISPVHVSLKGYPATDNESGLATAVVVRVHFRAPPKMKESRTMQQAETFSAQLHMEMDVPEKVMTLHDINLKADVGIANLHVPGKMQTINLSASVGSKDHHTLPLKNSGTVTLTITFRISRADDLFSVTPESLTIKPGEKSSVVITYTPKEAPSAIESLLTMKTEEDGSQYDITLRGEGAVEERSSRRDTPTLFSNKQFLSWGGVAVGRALQQKIVLRNSSSTLPLKLNITITGGTDFQLQSSFSSQLQLTNNKSLTLKPDEDFSVNILYAPTTTAVSQGLLVMKPVGGCTKYTVPLSGYGGVSSLSLEELGTVGETAVLPVGTIAAGQRRRYTVKVSNNGDRAAFVKALCFSDLTTRIKLPTTHLGVEPHEFVLQPAAVQELTVTYQPMEDSALCYSNSSMVAVVGLFYGDEIMRQQLIKSLRLGQARQFHMSSSNPLRGVVFDKTFRNEEAHGSETGLTSRPNDIQLFYSLMSRLMMALVGDAATGSTLDAAALSGIIGGQRTIQNGDATLPNTSRSSTRASSPPVKGTPAIHKPSTHRGPSGGSTDSWTLHPEQLILSASAGNSKSDSCGRIYVRNNTERTLSFELTWPGHILTLNPHNGVVQPNDQQMIFVSANPSIHSRGVKLPWMGSLRISCDNTEKEVRVQVREDLALDTTVVPGTTKKLHSLSTQLATPNTTPTTTPSRPNKSSAAVSPKELKVRSKVITCEDVHVGQSSEYIFEFENTKQYPMNWEMSSFAPAYLRQADGTICRTTYAVFRFENTQGKMTPGQKMQLSLRFTPREEGDYSQFWDLESTSSQNLVSHKTRLELSGKGLPSKAVTHSWTKTKIPSHQQPLDQTKASSARLNTSKSKEPNKKPAIVLSDDAVCFERCEVNQSNQVLVRLKNISHGPQKVKFARPRKPFSISHYEHTIKSRHYLKLPVTFHPTARGTFESPLLIHAEPEQNLVLRLSGECI